MAARTTYRLKPEPTFYASGKDVWDSSAIEYFYLPQGYIDRVARVRVMRDMGARVQAVKGTPPRDHHPLLLELSYWKDSTGADNGIRQRSVARRR